MKIAVLGAAGGIGQPLSLLLKNKLPAGSDLALYDVAPFTPGVAVDLSHIPTDVNVKGYTGDDGLTEAVRDASVVVIPAGVARKPGMDRSDLFNVNAKIIKGLVEAVAKNAPGACIAIITNPVNTMVPLAAEVLKKAGISDYAKKLFGVTLLDTLRAETFWADITGYSRGSVKIPVIGGHSGSTILPVFSQALGYDSVSSEDIEKLTVRVQNAGTEVVEAKAGAGSATLSMATAGARFALAIVAGLQGVPGVVESAYVADESGEFAPFFARQVLLGKNGVESLKPVGRLSDYEQKCLNDMLPGLKNDIQQGVDFVQNCGN
ncbi:malate dehydrogenase [Succinimonas amylolytica]|jgi:malate dehydrogenase|uniref:malate dehydrogenase n=1 Tax=Succinimonas amylolytica TaxID=83769 RepID=UPI00037BE078|nr:malate dehydrogenase [Succinimonas amylolytica]